MARIAYISHRFNAGTRDMIAQANEIFREYAAQGYVLTLRQVYYQFVARGLLANKQKNYDRLGETLSVARLAGLVDWSHMEDRTRNLELQAAWDSPDSILRAVADQYRRHLWEDQPYHVEVAVEKDALIGVLEPVCNANRVGYFACRGYFSQSEAQVTGVRYSRLLRQGKKVLLLHLGDHDPSGIDMTRDLQDRFDMFTNHHAGQSVEVRRIALNMDQILQYAPPPNPVKFSDSRADDYVSKFGDESWELDALEPTVIGALIQEHIDGVREQDLWDKAQQREDEEKQILESISTRYDDVREWIEEQDWFSSTDESGIDDDAE